MATFDNPCSNCGAEIVTKNVAVAAAPAAYSGDDDESLVALTAVKRFGTPASGATAEQRYVTDAMNAWSSRFTRLTLPSGLGDKAVISQCSDEGAKILSIGVYMGYRTAKVDAVPYDGSTYEGRTIGDQSTGTLWMYDTRFPDGFQPTKGEKFLVSLGHIFKCHRCSGQGRVRCSSCRGRIRWRDTNWQNEVVEKICSCGDGKMSCPECSGYGTMLKVLRVETSFTYNEKKEREYAGRLPQEYLMESKGDTIFRHVTEFESDVIAEAIDGFDANEFVALMQDARADLRAAISWQVEGQLVDPNLLYNMVDQYFRTLPNPVAENKRLELEVLPVRLKCEVTDVPVTAVKYKYKERDYSLYVYGRPGKVWLDGAAPVEFTSKIAKLLGAVAAVIGIIALIAWTSSGTIAR